MNILKPDYYDKFNCIADKCEDSCCIGWKVTIDEDTFKKYKRVKGPFKAEIDKGVKRNRKSISKFDKGTMELVGGRCYFLDDKNLCNIYKNLGQKSMCYTCKIYPRLIRKYGDIIEEKLTISCPEVARIVIDNKEQITFSIEDRKLDDLEKISDTNNRYDPNLYNLLWEARSLSIDVAQFREIPIWKRLFFIKYIEEKIQELIDNGDYGSSESTISMLKEKITSEDQIKILDSLDPREDVKINFVVNILNMRLSTNVSNNTFKKAVLKYNKIFDGKPSSESTQVFKDIEAKFSNDFKDYEYIMENYLVHSLFNSYMEALETKDINKVTTGLVLGTAVIKNLLIGSYFDSGLKIVKEDIINVIYSFSRVFEHNEDFMDKIYDSIKANGNNSLAYFTALVR